MIKRILIASALLFSLNVSSGQVNKAAPHPRLVIGVVIDQMRWDYLYRYQDLYSADGFKRLLSKGFSCENTFLPYVPTYTAVGHSCIYTGSVPAINGIIANDWFDEATGKNMYCTDDSTVNTVGSNSAEGKMSPRNLWVTTIGDELRLSNNFQSKVIGISLKDRASILPAGHSANAAYWYDGSAGKWITSTYYTSQLPDWVNKENDRKLPDQFMSKDWNTLLPASKYTQSTKDDEPYEGSIPGEMSPTFPHSFSSIKNKYEAFRFTPFAVTYTFDMAKAAIDNEKLGGGDVTDMLAISISSTDYIGHTFGPNSVEAEDAYLRLDRDIADFLNYLDKKLGAGNYIFFLTADHGVLQVPGFLKEHDIPSGTYNASALKAALNKMITSKYNFENAVAAVENNEVYMNHQVISDDKALVNVENDIVDYLKKEPYVANAFITEKIATSTVPEPIKQRLINGYNPRRSGEIGFYELPAYISGGGKGTTHGSWNPYDAHIPLLWYGYHIKPGKTNRETYMTDISATLAAMLKIQMPDGCVGKVIEELMN
ncbi:MAG TPA: alkaline phosphatase PafA [Chitinophagaceae bacterium]|nr:alkaline phosphatase PafA [Chitinophagaceae bacterium]